MKITEFFKIDTICFVYTIVCIKKVQSAKKVQKKAFFKVQTESQLTISNLPFQTYHAQRSCDQIGPIGCLEFTQNKQWVTLSNAGWSEFSYYYSS